MSHSFKQRLLVLLIIFIILVIYYTGITDSITLEHLKEMRGTLHALVQDHYALSIVAYIGTYILITTFSIPITAPLTLIGGFLFGTLQGTIATNIGATVGATLTFLIIRYLFSRSLQHRYRSQLHRFNNHFDQYGAQYLLLARMSIFIPFVLINIGAALTQIPLSTFIWTTSLGIIPGTSIYCYAGSNIGAINSLSDIFSPSIIIALLLIIGLNVISILISHMTRNRSL